MDGLDYPHKLAEDKVVKVCFFTPLPPPPGGIATWSSTVLPIAANCGDISISHIDTAVRWRSTNDLTLLKRLTGGAWQAVSDVFRTYFHVKKTKPHVLHLCSSGSLAAPKDILIVLLARILHVRTIVHYHMGRFPEIIASNTLEWKLIRYAMRLADTVILLDQKSEESVKNVMPGVTVIRVPNPIDLKLVQKVLSEENQSIKSTNVFRIVYAGHVIPAKGIHELVKACMLIDGYEIELNIVGNIESQFNDELKLLVSHHKGGEWLRIHGSMERVEAMRFIRDADIFVLPSYTEGFPNVVLEAMALGKAIVATNVGAIPEMLANGCGLLVNPRDVRSLANALSRLIADNEVRVTMGGCARARALAEFSLESVFATYMSVWRQLAGGRIG